MRRLFLCGTITAARSGSMRRLFPYLHRALPTLLGVIFLAPLSAAAIDADGRQLTVTTPNLTVVFDGGTVVSLQNRISGEIYSQTQMTSEQPDLHLLEPAKESPRVGGWSLKNGIATLD